MSKYLKNFEGHNDYDSYINNNPNLPNVSCCTTPYHVHYNPLPYPHMDVKIKKITNKSTYQLGDTIENRIFIYNDGNKDIINLEVETSDGTLISQKTIDLIPTGCYFVLEAAKTITEEVILNGYTTTHYTIEGVTYEDETVSAEGDYSSSIDEPNGRLTIVTITTSEPYNGESYALGETIEYEITVINDGNLTITDITVTDELTGDEWTINSLAPGQSVVFPTEYLVKEEDILAREVVNIATARGTSPDPEKPDVPVDPGEDSKPTEEPNGHLTIDKVTTSTSANGQYYVLGETIEYQVTVTNTGNLTITDITVTDDLTEDRWTIVSLSPGKQKVFEPAPYAVTEDDIINGEVNNVATATGRSPDPNEPDVPVSPGEDPEPTESQNPSLEVSVETTSEPDNGETYAFGETISYDITITNNGNLRIRDITLEGGKDYLTPSSISLPQTMLYVNESMTATYSVVVTSQDVTNGYVKFEATANGNNDGDEPTDPGTDEVEDPTYSPTIGE